MDMGMNTRRHVAHVIRQAGGVDALPIMDGPRLDRWNPSKLADALDHEIARCAAEGWPKISLHLDVPDAMKLVRCLRRL